MKAMQFWSLLSVRMILVFAAVWGTSYGSERDGKPIGFESAAALFAICSIMFLLLPCYRILDRRFFEKHGSDILLFLKYGYLGVFHGVGRWLLVATIFGKVIFVGSQGWWSLMQIPALLLTAFALVSGYPGLESYGLAVSSRVAKAQQRRLGDSERRE